MIFFSIKYHVREGIKTFGHSSELLAYLDKSELIASKKSISIAKVKIHLILGINFPFGRKGRIKGSPQWRSMPIFSSHFKSAQHEVIHYLKKLNQKDGTTALSAHEYRGSAKSIKAIQFSHL